jgi:hypothetical protein
MRLIVFLLLAVACGGTKEGEVCSLDEECASGLYCAAPNDPASCTIPSREECDDASECSDGACHAVFDSCSDDTVGSACGADCAVEGCSPGFSCGDDGNCVPTSCVDDPSVCGSHESCDAGLVVQSGPPHAMSDGCTQNTCTSDADCADFCVDGLCHTGPGVCILDRSGE